jgi:hypothetical protein
MPAHDSTLNLPNITGWKALTEKNDVHADDVNSQAARLSQTAYSKVTTPGEGDIVNGTEANISDLSAIVNFL